MGNGGAILGIPLGRPPWDMLGGRLVNDPEGSLGKADAGGVLEPFPLKFKGEPLKDMEGARGETGGDPLALFPGIVKFAVFERGDVLVPD